MMIVYAKFHQNPPTLTKSTKYRDITLCESVVNGQRTDSQPVNIIPLPLIFGSKSINTAE